MVSGVNFSVFLTKSSLDEGNDIISRCYRYFQEDFGEEWRTHLLDFDLYEQLLSTETQTHAQRSRDFKTWADAKETHVRTVNIS